MFSFGNPQYLFLLLFVPVVLGLFLLSRHARTKKLKKYGNLLILQQQMPTASRYTPWIRISLELLAFVLIVVMLARPLAKTEQELKTVKVQGSEVVVAVDLSNSMLASTTEDVDGMSRLQRTKHVVEKLFERLENDKVGLVVFAGDAFVQMPLTNDFSAAKHYLNSLSTNMIDNQGTAIGAAIETSMSLFSDNPQCQKSIVLITDGENHEDDAEQSVRAAKDAGVIVNVVGVGSAKAMPIPWQGGYLTTENGQVVTTAFNESAAMNLAKIGDGVYVSANNTAVVDILDDQLKKAKKTNMEKKVFTPANEQFPVVAWMVLALLVVSLFVTDKKISWLMNTNFFSKK